MDIAVCAGRKLLHDGQKVLQSCYLPISWLRANSLKASSWNRIFPPIQDPGSTSMQNGDTLTEYVS
jgi:hypothetical protein